MLQTILVFGTLVHIRLESELVSIEGHDELYELSAIHDTPPDMYAITQYIPDRPAEAYIIEPPARDWYVPRKVPFVHRCYKARPLQQDYG